MDEQENNTKSDSAFPPRPQPAGLGPEYRSLVDRAYHLSGTSLVRYEVEAIVAAAVAAERERCAKIADMLDKNCYLCSVGEQIAAKIRSGE